MLFIDKKDGYYLKIASSKTLEREAEMTAYFQKKKLGLGYISYLFSDNVQNGLIWDNPQNFVHEEIVNFQKDYHTDVSDY